jgi:hypothetical protein
MGLKSIADGSQSLGFHSAHPAPLQPFQPKICRVASPALRLDTRRAVHVIAVEALCRPAGRPRSTRNGLNEAGPVETSSQAQEGRRRLASVASLTGRRHAEGPRPPCVLRGIGLLSVVGPNTPSTMKRWFSGRLNRPDLPPIYELSRHT